MGLRVDIQHVVGAMELSVAFEAGAGVTAIFGRSGAGKTTLIRLIAGLERVMTGQIALNDRALVDTERRLHMPPHRRNIGYVFQDGQLFPHLTVAGNLKYGQRCSAQDHDQIIDMLDLGGLLARRPARLSGGEARRVALGRALMSAPALLLLDEPMTGLDQHLKDQILPYLERLRDTARIPILLVSHDLVEVTRLSNRMVVLDHGRVARSGDIADLLACPDMARVLGLRELGGILTARLAGHTDDGLSILHHCAGEMLFPRIDQPLGARLRIRLHAQDVLLSRQRPEGLSALNILPAQVVRQTTGAGGGVLVHLQLGQEACLARITQRSAAALDLQSGGQVFATLKSMAVARDEIGAGSA